VARLTVLTWNLQGRRPRAAGLPAVLAEANPDLVFLQEADASALADEPALAEWLAQSYADGAAGTRPGMAILSRLPLRQAATLRSAPETWDRPRVLVAQVAHASGEVMAVCVHAKAPLPLPFVHADARNRQLADLGEWVAQQRAMGQRLVVAGDFNAVQCTLDSLVDVGEALGSEDATWRPLAVPWFPGLLRLDRVFVSPEIRMISLDVSCGASRSDHCPVIVRLELYGRAPTAPG